ncbi:SLC13 family permease [Nitrosomonas ureae]|uniref:Di- and tricarboxylate transporter n=1 Tax=Nitrosomonas ureae TaxID=44577 RepID=A0A0S3AMN9_9PROT|nr:SLC13 family permease [Nitrosomonas ureae]ALQ52272.1 potassium transporter TrkA [Nitrosomonas ureae]PTQ81764.1 di/tricarboxylate transporter [Nitrosomonas ureae]PXX07965.1 di/tricarboxylate transporter [Nitrosomonas ureae]SDT92378.1 Di-and tricarboxylate transporter [Nitrosomonas ureae]SEQ50921.1 Di-and tricarboxylate transporter [Nitrosomonas ureae]
MEWQGWFTLGLCIAVLATLISTRIGPHLIMIGALTLLSALGILSSSDALSGFSNSGLITVAGMFVVAAGMHASGAIDLLVNTLLGRPATPRAALNRMFWPVAFLSSFLNNTPVVATMIPAIYSWSRKIGISPSKLMIPLSYAAILGGTVTLIGTSTNLIVNGQYQTLTGEPGFSLFSITAVGIPVAIAGFLFMWLFFPKLLPDRTQGQAFSNLREFTLEVSIAPDGPLVGKTIEQAGLRHLQRVYLIEIERNGIVLTVVTADEVLQGGDRLVFAGDTDAISDLLRIKGIVPSAEEGQAQTFAERHPERRLVEAVVSPHCTAVGYAIRDARFRARYGAAVLAVARHGERIKGNLGSIILQAGDTLLLEARPAFVTRQRYNKDFLLINDLNTEAPRHERAYVAWMILLGVITAASFEVITMLNAALIGAGLMIITGCCTANQAERSLDLKVIITIAASFSLGMALEKTGVAKYLAENIVDLSGGTPWLLLILTYITISLLTEVITNNAAALLMLPIVLEITEKADLNNVPFVFAIMMAASASFATPLGYQTNMMVYGPGEYRFIDFLQAGIPMNIIAGVVTITVLLIGWPLTK